MEVLPKAREARLGDKDLHSIAQAGLEMNIRSPMHPSSSRLLIYVMCRRGC
jgi:hypothetical protein